MINVIPFEVRHLYSISVQVPQKREGFFAPEVYKEAGEAFTGMLDGKPLFCVGRAHGTMAWAILSDQAAKHMVSVTRAMRRLLALHGNGYMEAMVQPGFTEAVRWMAMLGFRYKEYDPAWRMEVFERGVDLASKIAEITAMLSQVPECVREYPEVANTFSEGLYTRRMFIKKGTLLVGKIHLRETMNVCAKGDITILTEKGLTRFRAGDVIVSAPGVQKVGYAHEDTVWVNVWATEEKDVKKIEAEFVRDPDVPVVKDFVKALKKEAAKCQ